MEIRSCAIIGGDLRYTLAANYYCKKGIAVSVFGFDDCRAFVPGVNIAKSLQGALDGADVIILPVPYSTVPGKIHAPLSQKSINTSELVSLIKPTQIICGGKLDSAFIEEAAQSNISCSDYLKRDEFAILNAIPTAEGAIQIALEELPTTLHGTSCLVTGYGRIAKLLCHKLTALGATVYCAARKESDRAFISALGYTPLHTNDLMQAATKCSLIINTVPELLFSQNILQKLEHKPLIIDLASKPGGIDFDAAKALGQKVIWALSLPGKVAPQTAAEIICKTIENIAKEQEVKV